MNIEESVLLESDMYNPVWCQLKSNEIMVILNSDSKTEIRNAVMRTQSDRLRVFKTLMDFDVKNQKINLDYINKFGSYFNVITEGAIPFCLVSLIVKHLKVEQEP